MHGRTDARTPGRCQPRLWNVRPRRSGPDARGREVMAGTTGEHALVLGGSIAGLLAARVLADRYAAVTIVERDRLPDTATQRRGVPHGQHVHAMLPRGLQIIEGLLPGFTTRVVAAGG